jgi:hypothetical protein
MSGQNSDKMCVDRPVVDLDIATNLQRIRFALGISAGSSADAALTDRLTKFVQLYRTRSQDPLYYESVIEAIQDANAAAELIERVSQSLARLDNPHALEFETLLAALKDIMLLGSNLTEAVTILKQFQSSLRELAGSLELATSVNPKISRGRPRSKYVSETRELMEIYKEVTGKRVLFPKWIKAGVPNQESAEFICIALKMINPRITPPQAMTCIKKALKLNSQVDAILRELCPTAF